MTIRSTEDGRTDTEALIDAAQRGCDKSLGKLLTSFRPYLLAIAGQELDPRLVDKVGASDLVQETVVGALQGFRDFKGWTREDLLAWLRTILLNKLANTRRHYATAKRDASREVQVDAAGLKSNGHSASSEFRSLERQERVEQALGRLPDDYRQVILLRHREDLSFAQIAQMLKRSEAAVHKLWTRAVQQLRNELNYL